MESLAGDSGGSEWIAAGSDGRALRWLGDDRPDCLLVASAGSRHRMTSLAQLIPKESGRLTMVMADARLGAVASLAAKRTLRLRNGLPLFVPGRGWQVLAVDADGVPTWRPFAQEMAWRPHGDSRILNWVPPVDYLLPIGSGQLVLDERWLVEITESGLWVREQSRVDRAGLVRDLPLDAAYCTVVVSASAESRVQPPWRAIVKLLRRLPEDARTRLRVAVPESVDNWLARAAAKACRRHFNGRSTARHCGRSLGRGFALTATRPGKPWRPVLTAHPRVHAAAVRYASTSPSSMRMPSSLTWLSRRPRNCRTRALAGMYRRSRSVAAG